MTPIRFEAEHQTSWDALGAALAGIRAGKRIDGAELAALYRRACEHLALAQARAYPLAIVARLEALTQEAHRVVYRRYDYGLARLGALILLGFPQAVRAHGWYVWLAVAALLVPALASGWAAWADPEFILHVVSPGKAQEYKQMYGDSAQSFGRLRSADTDWQMFGFYIRNNIGVSFQCFASGFFAGLGSLFFLVYNGVLMGVVGGFLVANGHAQNFFSFVATHAAFELTAIALSGAAGLRLGHAWLSPGRQSRLDSLKAASESAVVVMYGVIGMLLLAAGVEAFWSSAKWIQPSVKYGVAALCWVLVVAYLGWQGRPRVLAAPLATASAKAGAA
jgi:uncharacterized membrane protein SpoIIM required for sporulation